MKQIKLTHILAVAFAAVTMLGFSACNDEEPEVEKAKTTKLEEEIKQKTDSLQTQVDDLQSQINDLKVKTCMCEVKTKEDVAKIIGDSLKNYWNINDVKNFVDTTLDHYVLVTKFDTAVNQLQDAIDEANLRLDRDSVAIDSLIKIYNKLEIKVNNAQNLAQAAYDFAGRDSVRINTLNTRVDTLVTSIYTKFSNINGRIKTLEDTLGSLVDTASFTAALAQLDQDHMTALHNVYTELHETDSLQAKDIQALKDTLANYADTAALREVRNHADALYAKAIHYSDSLYQIVSPVLVTLDSRITTLETVMVTVRDSLHTLDDSIKSLKTELDAVKAQVNENTRKIQGLTAFVNDVFSKSIYSLVIQGTYNPVFGYFALPLGWQSNVLVAYYGDVDVVEEFPTTYTSVLVYGEYPLTSEDVDMLTYQCSKYNPMPAMAAGPFVAEGPNAGKMYFNVNPNTADLTDATFTLVTTNGQESGIKLDTVKPSTEKLTFGYTGPTKAPVAGQSPNGFYEATATLDWTDIDAAKIQIDPQLKQSVKDFYHNYIQNKSARSAASSLSPSSFTGLAQGLYHQFNGFAPRYELKATWTDSLGTHSTVSGADVAAIAVKPLSYAFLKDRSFRHLPNITPLSEFDFNINVKDIHFNINFDLGHANTHLHLQAINFNFPDSLTAEITIPNVNAPADPITGQFPDSTYIAKASLENLEDSINNQFQRLIGHWNDSINAAINGQVDSLIQNINRQVNDFAADIEGQLNTEIQAVVNDAKDQVMSKFGGYLDKVNRVIGKVNSLINRVNRVLDNPNKFLQPILVYQGKDGEFHIMSTTKSIPSVFKGTGAITLYPTSYNAEIAAPAYKKFIGVTDVYKNGDMSKSAKKHDADCKTVLANANNNSPDFVKVLDGGRYGVAFVPTPGYTYEIFYAGYDYSGKISQRKYYVTVK